MKARYINPYILKRNRAVISAVRDNDIEPLRQLMVETSGVEPSSDEVVKATAHKMCCNIVSMPRELQDISVRWLEEHGMRRSIY